VAVRGVTGDEISITPFAIVALAVAVAVPLLFYPLAAGAWAGLDLAARPLDEAERLDADFHAGGD
jgi:hypothetical protein